ncbi:MAG: hypothetical protein CME60_08610 [Halobacteriovoraceae bacterium]|nr:hypothetical protein [Halobacteriovoraceae bacterium]
MDVTSSKKWRLLFFTSLSAFSNIQNTFAEMLEKGKTKITSVFNFYHQNSDNGGQVIDNSGREETNVFEPMVFIEHQITEDTALTGQITFDAWTAASDTKLDSYTGASNGDPIKGQTRVSGNLGAKQEKGKWSYGAKLGFSSEYDYQSLNGSLNLSRSFANDNFVLSLGIQYYSDQLSAFQDLSSPETAKIKSGLNRNIFSTNLTASQLLSPYEIIQFDLTFARSSGFLESTANSVNVNGQRFLEELPDSRSRYALSTKYVRALTQASALHLSYRYYFDQWNIDSHTSRVAYLKEINDDEDFIEVSLRHHFQEKAKYYKDSFTIQESFMTSDSDMNQFHSYESGIYYKKNLEDSSYFGVKLENLTWSHGLVYYQRNTGLRLGYYQSSISFEF